ncbi:MAG: hypothetical protein COV35_10610 [Alphaproteobacteria bacterium CG11_big_fil_rev_8_21_14_0_20_39_49]|nr:MAG: hypothetical protein COV35_10610 [Alphaproteobacteria bacterium CG11_big_fil_rev_8_21_14_0_20_39_49]
MPIRKNIKNNTPLQTVMDTILDGLIIIDKVGTILSFNPAASRIFGYTAEEVVGRNVKMLMPNPYHNEHDSYIRNYIKTNDAKVIGIGREVSAKRKNGKVFPIELGINEMVLEGKLFFVGMIRDISKQKKAEKRIRNSVEALKESQAFLKLIMDNNPDLVFVKDKDFKMVEANLACRSVYPKEMQDKIIGYTTIEEYSPKEAEAFLEMDKKAFKKGYSETFETIRFPDGKKRTLYTQKIRFKARNGEKFILGIGRDVTERESLIQSLTDSNEELERFAYLASHDLQEPLRMVVNFTELLESEYSSKLPKEAREYLRFASSAGHRMQIMVNDLLEYSRVGQEAERLVNVDFNLSLEDAKENLMESIKQHNAEITNDKLPVIKANPIRITRLFQNIIGNAIKYTDDNKKPKIHITAIQKNNSWLFSITDNGIGMNGQYLEKIFIPFKRLHSYNDYKGTGVGLSICKKIVENLGGKIWVESRLGQGSTFFFTIPKSSKKEN